MRRRTLVQLIDRWERLRARYQMQPPTPGTKAAAELAAAEDELVARLNAVREGACIAHAGRAYYYDPDLRELVSGPLVDAAEVDANPARWLDAAAAEPLPG